MCPGCPTFSIPVPIPKASLAAEQQESESTGNLDYQTPDKAAEEKNFLEKIRDKISSTMKGIQTKTMGLFDPILSKGGNFLGLSDDTNTITEKKGDAGGSSKTSYLPMMVAGAAAVALGGLALFGSGPQVSTINARSLDSQAAVEEETTAILESIDDATTKYEKQEQINITKIQILSCVYTGCFSTVEKHYLIRHIFFEHASLNCLTKNNGINMPTIVVDCVNYTYTPKARFYTFPMQDVTLPLF